MTLIARKAARRAAVYIHFAIGDVCAANFPIICITFITCIAAGRFAVFFNRSVFDVCTANLTII